MQRMNFLSFDARDPVFTIGNWKLSFQIVTLENLYGLDPALIAERTDGDNWYLDCAGLCWAGQQERVAGSVSVQVRREGGQQLRIVVEATAPEPIRAVKILIRDLPAVTVLDLQDSERPVSRDGLVENYPSALELPLPLWFVRLPTGEYLGLRCEDPHARAKRFAAYEERLGAFRNHYAVECIHEEDARWFDKRIKTPPWILARHADVVAFRGQQLAFAEAAFNLRPWEQRADMPAWLHDLRLCVTLHGMHWTGYIFNDYDAMLNILRFVAARIDGGQVLAYIVGWEGRYYWQYGDYRPDPRLGGEAGFDRLCREARAMGIHVMPMFGGNVVNAWLPGFHTYGPSSYLKSAARLTFDSHQPDWDTSRAYDNGWQAWLNPGAPAWQHELTRQIHRLIDRFGFDSVYLDTVQHWTNDPDFNLREGLQQLVMRLRTGYPDLMIMAEDWWDGILPLFPIYLRSGWWRQVPPWIERYARLIGHLWEGEASRGSTGVHEEGCSPYQRLPESALYIPTVAFVDGTLEQAQSEIEAVIALASRRL